MSGVLVMSYYHDLKNTMTEEKKKNAKNDYFALGNVIQSEGLK